jgi:3-methyladenine DNA glycosylase Mpg
MRYSVACHYTLVQRWCATLLHVGIPYTYGAHNVDVCCTAVIRDDDNITILLRAVILGDSGGMYCCVEECRRYRYDEDARAKVLQGVPSLTRFLGTRFR